MSEPRDQERDGPAGTGPRAPVYRSGRDFEIHVGEMSFAFSADDFAERVGGAAERLGLVRREELGSGEVEDLVALCANGCIDRPRSALAAHVGRHAGALLGHDEDLVHWLRRLVFRGAWIDQHVADGRLEPVFEEGRGFRYRSSRSGRRVEDEAPTPDWSALGYRAA
jgi:hypothetical protein